MLSLSALYSSDGPCLVQSNAGVYVFVMCSLNGNFFLGTVATLNSDGTYTLSAVQTVYSGVPAIWTMVSVS